MDDPANRDPAGRFGPGNKANPSGRPKAVQEFQNALKERHYSKALDRLYECLDDRDGRVRVAAIKEVFDRLFGKPKQTISGDDGQTVAVAVDITSMLQRMAGKGG